MYEAGSGAGGVGPARVGWTRPHKSETSAGALTRMDRPWFTQSHDLSFLNLFYLNTYSHLEVTPKFNFQSKISST